MKGLPPIETSTPGATPPAARCAHPFAVAGRRQNLYVYLKYILLAALLIGVAATTQIFFVFKRFEPQFVIVPVLVAITLGALLGRVAVLGERLRRRNAQFRAVADLAQEFTYLRSVDGRYEYVSPSCLTLTGCSPEEFYSTSNLMDRLIHPDDRERWERHVHRVNNAGEPANLDVRLVTRDGRTVWISHLCAPVFDEGGEQIGVRSTNLDITERKTFEERIERMAYYDALTGLPNRNALRRELETRLAAEAAADQALLYLDLAWFKHINDSFGNATGDALLRQVAQRLREVCAARAWVSRFGGDEFVILLPGIAEPEAAEAFAREILEALERPFQADNREFYLSGSVGVAFYPYDSRDPDTLVHHADAAMYQAKRERQGQIRFFRPDIAQHMSEFISLENRLRKAIKAEQFTVHYQPIVRFSDGAVVGLEALARWNDPERGLISPAEFIPVAEETGLIGALGEQILRQVCAQLRAWHRAGSAIKVAVNVSARQFADPDFVSTLVGIARAEDCPLGQLKVEVTEQLLLGDLADAVKKLEALRGQGIRIALDDFGTGYSSLAYLKQLPIDTVKVDRAFVKELTGHTRDQAILRSVVTLCRDLELELVAEGIETHEQRQLLEGIGCRLGQGFLFSRPAPAQDIALPLTEAGSAVATAPGRTGLGQG